MTLNQLIEIALKLRDEGYGEAHVLRLEDHEEYSPYAYGIYAPYEFTDETTFGNPFDNQTKEYVYLDREFHSINYNRIYPWDR